MSVPELNLISSNAPAGAVMLCLCLSSVQLWLLWVVKSTMIHCSGYAAGVSLSSIASCILMVTALAPALFIRTLSTKMGGRARG